MKMVKLITFLWFALADAPAFAAALNGADILKKVDSLRNPLASFQIDVDLVSYRNQESEAWKMRVFGQGTEKSLVEFVDPASQKGQYLLMLNDAMWIYLPGTSRPIRISPLQRLMGEASNGDVARTNYSIDYNAELAGEEVVADLPCYRLELTAKDATVSYNKVTLWVSKSSYEPIKADFYVVSGKLMKHAFFTEFGVLNGNRAITAIEIQDAIRPGRRTVMRYSKLQPKGLPEKMFNKNYLGKW
jgi:outer membrane lipoprotein-sorting protein